MKPVVTVITLFYSLILLNCFTGFSSSAQHRHRAKRKGGANAAFFAFDVGSFVISTTIDIVSLIEDNAQQEEIMSKLNDIDRKISDLAEQTKLTTALLRTLAQELSKSLYGNIISDAEREIDHCFDVLKEFARTPDSIQSLNNMKGCYSYISHVKQIGKIAVGEKIGINPLTLFDIFIQQHGYCNGTELVGLQSYLAQLLMRGCSAVITAEILDYQNTSAQYKDYCLKTLNETDNFRITLFKSCAGEACNVVVENMAKLLRSTTSTSQAVSLLSDEFPWFYFMVVETIDCSRKCSDAEFTKFGNISFNLQTYQAQGKTFIVSYQDERFKTTGDGNPGGFDMPQSCNIVIHNDLGFGINDISGSTLLTMFMYEDKTAAVSTKICSSPELQCLATSAGRRSNTFTTVAWITGTVLIFALTNFAYFV